MMKWLLSKNMMVLLLAAAMLIFAIRFFETGFQAGKISTRIYVTVIGIIFLAVGAYTASRLWGRRTVVQYIEKEPTVTIAANDLLTERENEILKAIAMGMSNRQISELLFVSENTVKKHINNIFFKLDVNRRTQAVARAKELKILTQ